MRGAIEVEAPGPSGLWNVRVPNTQTLLTEAHDVMFAVRAFWRELYDNARWTSRVSRRSSAATSPGSLREPGHRSSSTPCRT